MAAVGMTYEEVSAAADHIKALTNDVQSAAEELQDIAKACVNRGIQMEWANDLLANLEAYNNNQMKEALEEMKLQADKLTKGAEYVQTFDNGNKYA